MKKLIARGYEFTYLDEGLTNPIVFVHGSALDFRYWNNTIGELSQRFRCIALSRRFHWPVPADVTEATYSALEQTEDVISFLDEADLGPVHLVGHSYGGYLCARVAAQRPELLRSLTLVEPGGKVAGLQASRSLAGEQQAALELIERGEIREGVATYLNSVCGPSKWQRSPVELQEISLANVTSIKLQMQDTSRPALTEELLSRIRCPTLVMLGALSPSPFPETARRISEIVENCQLEEIPEASHLINIDNFNRFISVLMEFCSCQGALSKSA